MKKEINTIDYIITLLGESSIGKTTSQVCEELVGEDEFIVDEDCWDCEFGE